MNPLLAVPPGFAFLVAAVVAALIGSRRGAHLVGVAVAAVAVPWVLAMPSGTGLTVAPFGPAPPGFDLVLVAVDPVSRAVGSVFAFVALADVVYSYGTGGSDRTVAASLSYVGASFGVAFAGDWLTLVVWWELMAVAATAILWQSPGAVRAGYRYAVYHQVGGAALAAGVLLHYARVGTFAFGDGIATGLPALLALVGVGINVGVIGLHVWIVDSYPRPSVASSVVLVGFTTKAGVYALVRLLPDGSPAVAYLGGAMVLVGVTMAILQTDARRLLSYHVVSQVGYMVAAIGLGTAAGTAGGVAHLVNNVLYKTLLFMVAGAIVLETGRENLKKVGGLGRSMPRTAGAFAVAALAITGVPGFSGFVSKGFVTSATTAAGAEPLWWVLQVGAVGTVVSFAKFGYYAFVRDSPGGDESDPSDPGPAVTVAFALLAVPCVAFGVAPGSLAALLPAGASTSSVFATGKLSDAAVITVAGLVAFVGIRRPLARVASVPDLDALFNPAGRIALDGGTRAVAGVEATIHATAAIGIDVANAALTDEDRIPGPVSIGTAILILGLILALALLASLLPG